MALTTYFLLQGPTSSLGFYHFPTAPPTGVKLLAYQLEDTFKTQAIATCLGGVNPLPWDLSFNSGRQAKPLCCAMLSCLLCINQLLLILTGNNGASLSSESSL